MNDHPVTVTGIDLTLGNAINLVMVLVVANLVVGLTLATVGTAFWLIVLR